MNEAGITGASGSGRTCEALNLANLSLITRVIILNILLLVIGIGSFTLFHLQREREHLNRVSRENAETLIHTIERAIFNAMRTGNTEEVQAILEMVGHSPYLGKVRIFHPSGIVLKSSAPEEIGHPAPDRDLDLFRQGVGEATFQVDGAEVIGIVSPIRSEENCVRCHGPSEKILGILNLNLSLADTNDQIAETSRLFLFSTLVIIVLMAGGISWVLLRFVKKPIRQVAQQMARVEQGDLSVRVNPRYGDEIGRLAHSFNSMVDNLQKAKTQLQDYHYRQMERADRLAAVGEMSTGIAHEIKNPLAGISGAMSVLADGFDEGDERKQIIREVLDQLARLNKTATDLLHFGRPAKPEFTYADVNELVAKTLFFVGQHPEAKKVSQEKTFAADLPPVWVDEKQIQQVLFNIVVNALQAMPDGGTLTVATRRLRRAGRDWVQVEVADSGVGIGATALEQIFTPFFTTKTQGTGLGLAICKQLLEQHGGMLAVASREGQGSKFTMELPVGQPPTDSMEEGFRGEA